MEYVCNKEKACVIDKSNRKQCQYCRLKKCLDQGMSITGKHLIIVLLWMIFGYLFCWVKTAVKGDRHKTKLKYMIESHDYLLRSPPEKQKNLNKEDVDLMDICLKLFHTTIMKENESAEESTFNSDCKLNCEEFSQNGIKQYIKFCMNLPGNSELCTDDRAKLLKYGVYEIFVRKYIKSIKLFKN